MSCIYQESIVNGRTISGAFTSNSDVYDVMQIPQGYSGIFKCRFALPKSTQYGKGSKLLRLKVCYKVHAGAAVFINPSIEQMLCAVNNQPTLINIPINYSGFQLIAAGQYVGVIDIITPNYNNVTAGSQFAMYLAIQAGTNGITFTIDNIEAEYEWAEC